MDDVQIRAIRQMYSSVPSSFFQLAFRLLHPRTMYLHNWSIDVLGEALGRCHRRETTWLIVNMPPRSLKSFCASVAMPAWMLGVRPDSKIMCVSGHRSLAAEHHDQARRLMAHEKYRSLFPHLRVAESGVKLRVAQGGYRMACTPGSALAGHGADVIIIDDPQSPLDASDPNAAALIREWYDRNIYQRLNDKQDGVIILVMQRLAQDDLTAHLIQQGGWEVLSLPSIANEDEHLPKALGGGLARRAGEALHPDREDIPALREAMLRMSAKVFMSQYQQKPYPPGEGVHRGGSCHFAPHPDATMAECKFAPLAMGLFPEERFVLDELFGERTCLRMGPPPPLKDDEEWLALMRAAEEELARKRNESPEPGAGGPDPLGAQA